MFELLPPKCWVQLPHVLVFYHYIVHFLSLPELAKHNAKWLWVKLYKTLWREGTYLICVKFLVAAIYFVLSSWDRNNNYRTIVVFSTLWGIRFHLKLGKHYLKALDRKVGGMAWQRVLFHSWWDCFQIRPFLLQVYDKMRQIFWLSFSSDPHLLLLHDFNDNVLSRFREAAASIIIIKYAKRYK